jgi:hypothetical protein
MRETYTTGSKIIVRWCLGYAGIISNKEANKEARVAAERPENNLLTVSLTAAKRQAKIYIFREFSKVWVAQALTQYKELSIPLKT